MAQTTNAVPQACQKVEISTDVFVAHTLDISGETMSVAGVEQSRVTGEVYTFDGDTAIVKGGKRQPMDVTFAIVYTEDAAEAYEIIRAVFETAGCDCTLSVRWSPAGGSVGDKQLTMTGILSNFIYPAGEASAGNPIAAGFTIRGPSVSTADVST